MCEWEREWCAEQSSCKKCNASPWQDSGRHHERQRESSWEIECVSGRDSDVCGKQSSWGKECEERVRERQGVEKEFVED